MGLLDLAIQGVTEYQMAKLAQPRPNSPYIPDILEYGFAGAPTSNANVVIDNATGTVISMKKCKTRKRRRRIATATDISDIAGITAILGKGKAFEVYMATRGRR